MENLKIREKLLAYVSCFVQFGTAESELKTGRKADPRTGLGSELKYVDGTSIKKVLPELKLKAGRKADQRTRLGSESFSSRIRITMVSVCTELSAAAARAPLADMDAADKQRQPDVEPLNLDTILVQEVGQFGPYQLRTLFLAALIATFAAWSAGEYIFTTARTPTRCFIEECDGDVPEYEPPWITAAVPATSSGFDNCARFENRTVPPDEQLPVDACPAQLFDPSATRPCDAYVYENTHSVVADFGLECDEWRRTLIGSIRTVGTLTVLPLTGFVSDRWGRRTALALNAFNTAWLGLARYWANTYLGFLISEFVEASFGSGGFSCAYILELKFESRIDIEIETNIKNKCGVKIRIENLTGMGMRSTTALSALRGSGVEKLAKSMSDRADCRVLKSLLQRHALQMKRIRCYTGVN
ncbi:Solute carrier family 22 member 7 [Eumeta japonica]|uniref:Solute carrier family 22 member 7 n=1 Tax=Eumeta variegata TaxID=151549 RepID=A0A4C1WUU9_EUMVA|nr:Solute carrier family 22 member 7 [Eumeta japonica]